MFCFFAVTGSEYESMVDQICAMGFEREQVNHTSPVHMPGYCTHFLHVYGPRPDDHFIFFSVLANRVLRFCYLKC